MQRFAVLRRNFFAFVVDEKVNGTEFGEDRVADALKRLSLADVERKAFGLAARPR